MLFAESTATRSPGLDAELEQRGRDPAHERVVLAVGQAAVALHDPVDVAAAVGARDEVAHRREPLAVHLQRDAEDVLDDDLERPARARSTWLRASVTGMALGVGRRPFVLGDVEAPQLGVRAHRTVACCAPCGRARTPGCSPRRGSPPRSASACTRGTGSRSSFGRSSSNASKPVHPADLTGPGREPGDQLVGPLRLAP